MRKAIFWDFDGTLVQPGHLWSGSLLKALGPLAGEYHITLEQLRPPLQNCFPWNPGGSPALAGPSFWAHMNARFEEIYISLGLPAPAAKRSAQQVRGLVLSPKSYQVRPDAAATLAVCAYNGWKNYILSNNYPELEQVVAGLGLGRFFSGYVVSGAVGLNKPDVKIFRLAERAARFPSLIWMVGDNPESDIAGGRAAGWHTALVSEGGQPYSGAQATVSRLSDLPACLQAGTTPAPTRP